MCAQHLRSTLLVSILQLPPCPGSAVVMASPLPAGVGQSLPSVQQVKDAAQTLIEQVGLYRSACIRGCIYVRAHWTDETNADWSTVDALNLAPVEHTLKEYM